jgi:hypothetical protein
MPTSVRPNTRRIRLAAAVALALALFVAFAVLVGLRDGGWPLLVPAVAAAAVLAWPKRAVVVLAILATAAIMLLGLMTVGIFFGASLAALILALAEFRQPPA